MDPLERKRSQARDRKRKEREKLKKNESKYVEKKRRDDERKKVERQAFKKEVKSDPRKYVETVKKLMNKNSDRVKRFRERQKLIKKSKSPLVNVQKMRMMKEIKRNQVSNIRVNNAFEKEANRRRVEKFRLRVQLMNLTNSPVSTANPIDNNHGSGSPDAYQHRSSETRAFQRVASKLPNTPAKKIRIIEKLLLKTTPRSRKVLSMALQTPQRYKQAKRKLSDNYNFFESVKNSVLHLKSQKQKKSVVRIIAGNLLKKSRKLSVAARALGMSRKTVARNVNTEEDRKTRNDKLSAEDASLVHNFYLEEASRPMPNKRDVLLIRDENGEKKEHVQKHLMEMTQESAFTKFKETYPTIQIQKRKFDSLRPVQVKNTTASSRIVCCCTYCENIRLKVQALNMISNFMTTNDVVNSTMCEKTGIYPMSACLNRQCDNCGTIKLKEQLKDVAADRIVKWKEWRKQTMPLDAVRSVSRVTLINCEAPYKDFIDKLCLALEPHANHIFRANWQYKQFRDNIANLQDGELVMAMDFSENYTCRHGREIQSFHWNQRQITIHPMMLYYLKDGELQKEGYTVFSDDLKHDAHAVSVFEDEAIKHVRNQGVQVNKIHQWTDGCAAQYKGRHSFAEISQAEAKHNASVVRNYFETSHGKGPCDGLGGIIKRKVSSAILQNNDVCVSDANELNKFCSENLSLVGDSSYNSRRSKYTASKRSFKLIETIDRSNATTAKTLPGSRKLHSISSVGIGFQLKVRQLSCYCEGCRNNTVCMNKDYVDDWEQKVLKPVDNTIMNQEQEPIDEVGIQDTDVVQETEYQVNDFVGVKFTTRKTKVCFFGKISDIENGEICVEYLEKKDTMYQYPDEPEDSWLSVSDIICHLPTPETVVNGSRIKLNFHLSEEIKQKLKEFKLR